MEIRVGVLQQSIGRLIFWHDYRKSDIAAVTKHIPTAGEVDNKQLPVVELFRQWQNMYYRLYNDGDTPHWKRLNKLAKRYDEIYFSPSGPDYAFTMEQVGERLLDDAIEEIKSVG